MSAKITAISLDGKWKTLTRVRAQRLVDSGSHDWQGPRTVREKMHAKAVPSYHTRIIAAPEFFYDFDYPDQGDGLKPIGYHILPYTYPLPLEILRHYQ